MLKFLGITLLISVTTACTMEVDRLKNHAFSELSEADSLKVIHSLFKDLNEEVYHLLIPVDKDTLCIVSYGCEPRIPFSVKMNSKNQLMVRNEIGAPIVKRLIEWYTENREHNDVTNNFPMYSRMDLDEIKQTIDRTENELYESEMNDSIDPEILVFKREVVDEWKKRSRVLKTIKSETLPEISGQAYVKLEYLPENKDHASLVDSVLLGFYQLRNERAEFYFKESYRQIYYRYTQSGKKADKDKLEALEILVPIRVIDKPNLKKYRLYVDKNYDPYPSPPEP